MDKTKIFAKAAQLLVSSNWDLPKPGRLSDLRRKYFGPDDEVREELKLSGRKLQQAANFEDQLIGYLLESYGHFYASTEAAMNQGRKHPDFEEYFAHWFYSHPDYVTQKARDCFSTWVIRPRVLKIQPGKSMWRYRQQLE